eukprot:scaffold1841_cov61-Phaeocystis_antarctica.AAC.6
MQRHQSPTSTSPTKVGNSANATTSKSCRRTRTAQPAMHRMSRPTCASTDLKKKLMSCRCMKIRVCSHARSVSTSVLALSVPIPWTSTRAAGLVAGLAAGLAAGLVAGLAAGLAAGAAAVAATTRAVPATATATTATAAAEREGTSSRAVAATTRAVAATIRAVPATMTATAATVAAEKREGVFPTASQINLAAVLPARCGTISVESDCT